MLMTFFTSAGWEAWDTEHRPLIPERMPVLIDDDMLFEDGPGAPRPAVAVNRWLRELPGRAGDVRRGRQRGAGEPGDPAPPETACDDQISGAGLHRAVFAGAGGPGSGRRRHRLSGPGACPQCLCRRAGAGDRPAAAG